MSQGKQALTRHKFTGLKGWMQTMEKHSLWLQNCKSSSLPVTSLSFMAENTPHKTATWNLEVRLEVFPVHNVPTVGSIWEKDEKAGEGKLKQA